VILTLVALVALGGSLAKGMERPVRLYRLPGAGV
jgi:hypothetical protein